MNFMETVLSVAKSNQAKVVVATALSVAVAYNIFGKRTNNDSGLEPALTEQQAKDVMVNVMKR
jgi:hypothetical protein